MGVKIVVDYENIPSKAKKIREDARQINSKLLDVYSQLENMQNSWRGTKYEELIKKYTTLIPTFNESLEVIVTEIPYMFETIANEFSNIDIQKNITTAQRDVPNKISEIKIAEQKDLKYIMADVEKAQNAIIADFNEINNLLENIGTTIGQIQIDITAMTEFSSYMKKFIIKYKELINDNFKQFSSYMEEVKNTMQLVEKNNTIQ